MSVASHYLVTPSSYLIQSNRFGVVEAAIPLSPHDRYKVIESQGIALLHKGGPTKKFLAIQLLQLSVDLRKQFWGSEIPLGQLKYIEIQEDLIEQIKKKKRKRKKPEWFTPSWKPDKKKIFPKWEGSAVPSTELNGPPPRVSAWE